MQIRSRLTLQFMGIGGFIMFFASSFLYYAASGFRQEDFAIRLLNKAQGTAAYLFDSPTIDPARVDTIEKVSPINLHEERVTILNFLNDTVYTSDRPSIIRCETEFVERIRLGETIGFRQDSFEVVGTLVFAKFDRFVSIAAAVDRDGANYLRKLKNNLFLVGLMSLLVFFIAGWFYSGRALKPISKVIGEVDKITVTSLNLRVNVKNGTDEIGKLALTFNKMLERLETAFALQKVFIANASHELRTPLTAINGQLEVLMLKDRTTEEYKLALHSVLDDIRALIGLSNRLLMIARTSAEGPLNFSRKLRMDEILWQTQEEVTRFNPGYQVNIHLDPSLSEVHHMEVAGDESLLKVVVSNLMDNACKYSPEHAVAVTLKRTDKDLEVIFEDKGIGIPDADLQHIFEPFFRSRNTQEIGGTGIGLALVNQIVKNHNARIKVHSVIGKGTRISVYFPLQGQN